jgi:two-component system, NtrC family, sensor histidine kinase HydH
MSAAASGRPRSRAQRAAGIPAGELRALIEQLREPVVVADAGNAVVFCNAAAEQSLGSPRVRLIGRPLSDVLPLAAADTNQPGPGWRIEQVGTYRVAFGDILSDLRWMQRMLQAEQLAAVGQLAASVAHEVGAPLTAITVAVDQLLSRSCGSCAIGSRDLEIVLSQTRRIAVLSRRLVDLAKPGDPLLRAIDFNSCIAEAFELVEKQLRRDEVRTSLSLDAGIGVVRADPHQMQQVLINLMLNAGAAMRDGGGRIDVTTAGRGSWVELIVADTGPGISGDDMPRVFLPFFSRSGGTGLGLPLCRQIAHGHGGTIDVESSPGAGSRFTVRLPAGTDDG